MSARSQDTLKVKRVFIGSPGDLSAERKLFKEVIEHVNRTQAKKNGVLLEAVGWEDTLPGAGRPQAIISRDLARCDLVVLLLWKRWGTPTGKYSSGFEEEYELAKAGKKDIILYFRNVPEAMLADAGDQLRKVLDFRTKIEKENALLYRRYGDKAEWRSLFDEHLCDWLSDQLPKAPEPIKDTKEYEDRIGELTRALKAAKTTQAKAAYTFAMEAESAAHGGRITKAEELFAQARGIDANWRILNKYGIFLGRIGNLKGALEKFEAVRNSGESANDPEAVAAGVGNLGNVYLTQGDLKRAEEMYGKALAINEKLGRKKGMAANYGSLGIVYRTRGNLNRAEEMLKKALSIHKEFARKEVMANDYCNLGTVYNAQGDTKRAEEMYKKALALNKKLGRKEGMATNYGNLGNVCCRRGDLKRAEEMHKKALAIDRKLGLKEGIARHYCNLGDVYCVQRDPKRAEEMYKKALVIAERVGLKEGMAITYCNLGIIYRKNGDLKRAEEMYKTALSIDEQLGRKEGIAVTCHNLAALYILKGMTDQAEEMARKSVDMYVSLGNRAKIKDTRALLARIEKLKRTKPSRVRAAVPR